MKHIYIIEDDVSISEALTFLLEKTYKVTAILDARIALKKLKSQHADLILLDLLMPHLNGERFIEMLSIQAINIPILVMSASSSANDYLKSRIVGFVRKPFQIDEMVKTIAKILKK